MSTNEASLAEQLAAIRVMRKQLEAWESSIYDASLRAEAGEKVASDEMASLLAEAVQPSMSPYPMTVNGIAWFGDLFGQGWRGNAHAGRFVSVRPVDEQLAGRTFLGVYIGDLSIHRWTSLDTTNGILRIFQGGGNPAIWVPELKRCVLGVESWWGFIKKPEDLKQITDADINSIWYVQALRALSPS